MDQNGPFGSFDTRLASGDRDEGGRDFDQSSGEQRDGGTDRGSQQHGEAGKNTAAKYDQEAQHFISCKASIILCRNRPRALCVLSYSEVNVEEATVKLCSLVALACFSAAAFAQDGHTPEIPFESVPNFLKGFP